MNQEDTKKGHFDSRRVVGSDLPPWHDECPTPVRAVEVAQDDDDNSLPPSSATFATQRCLADQEAARTPTVPPPPRLPAVPTPTESSARAGSNHASDLEENEVAWDQFLSYVGWDTETPTDQADLKQEVQREATRDSSVGFFERLPEDQRKRLIDATLRGKSNAGHLTPTPAPSRERRASEDRRSRRRL